MKKIILLTVIMTILLTVGFSGCNEDSKSENIYLFKSDQERLIGFWNVTVTYKGKTASEQTWELNSDDNYKIYKKEDTVIRLLDYGAWNITNNSLVFNSSSDNFIKILYYVFSNNYYTVNLTDSKIIEAVYICNRQI